MYIMHDMLRTASQAERKPHQVTLGDQVAGMRRRGMSATAIRRALGLNARDAVAAGIFDLEPTEPPRRAAPAGRQGNSRPTRPNTPPRGPAMRSVLEAVARAFGVAPDQILGPGQARAAVRPRQITMHLVRELCAGASLPAIGHFLSRDHTTVLYGCRCAEALLARDVAYRELRDRALRLLREAGNDQG